MDAAKFQSRKYIPRLTIKLKILNLKLTSNTTGVDVTASHQWLILQVQRARTAM